jgi:hypothetical protein
MNAILLEKKQLENGYYTRKLQTYDNNSYRKHKINVSEYYHPTGGKMSDKTPEQIFLQWFDQDGEPVEEVTWCKDQILDSDVVYVRSDIAEDALRKQTAKTIEMIAERNAIGHALDEQTARIADLEALCEIQELNLNKCHQSNIGLNEQAHTLRARIAELEAENARLREAQRWIPVGERLPENFGLYLVFYGDDDCYGAEHGQHPSLGEFSERVTHWMPLPPPPHHQE